MKKITSFVVLLAALLLTLPAQAFTWNWAEHELPPFISESGQVVFGHQSASDNVFQGRVFLKEGSVNAANLRRAKEVDPSTIITEVPQTAEYKVYTRSGKYHAFANPVYTEADQSGNVTIAFDGDDVYIKDPFMDFPEGTWMKGTKSGNTITFPLGQLLFYNSTQGYGVYTTMANVTPTDQSFTGVNDTEATAITYTINQDGSISMNGTSATYTFAGAWTDDETVYTYGAPGEYSTVFTPSTVTEPDKVVPPVGMATTSMPISVMLNGSTAQAWTVNVGFAGDEVYIQGIDHNLPESWVKGTLSGTTVTFPIQYIGLYRNAELHYLAGYSGGGLAAATFAYDAEDNTFSAGGSLIIADNDQTMSYHYFYNSTFIGNPPTPVTPPAGLTTEDFPVSGTQYTSSSANSNYTGTVKVGFDGTDVYIQGLLPHVPAGWVKGSVQDGKVVFPKGQYVGEDTQKHKIYLMGYANSAIADVTFTYYADAKLFISDVMIFANGKKDALGFYYPYFTTGLTIGTDPIPDLVTLPDGAEVTTTSFKGTQYSNSQSTPFQMAVKWAKVGDDIYVAGLNSYSPDTWIKGTKDGNGNLTFTQPQNFGTYKTSSTTYQFFMLGTDGNGAVEDVVFKYDADNDNYVLQNNLLVNGKKRVVSYYKWFEAGSILGPVPTDVTVEAADITNGDITAAVVAKSFGCPIMNLTINLAAGGDYKITAPIEAYASVLINGAAGATIDASTLTGDNAIIKLPAGVSDMTNFGQIAFNNVNMKIATRLVYANKSKFWIEKIAVDNCVISVDGTFKKSIFDCNSGGNVKLLSVNNSTIYADPKIGQNGGFFSSQSSQKPTEFGAEETQTFQITNSTLYNITNGNNMVTLRENNKAYLNFIFKNNVIVNCGKNKEFFKGFGSANLCASSTWDVDGNIVNFGGVDTSADDLCGGEIKNPIKGVVTFKAAATGDFNATLGTEDAPATETTAVGDPRWTVTNKQVPANITIGATELEAAANDISAALATAATGKIVGNLTVNLAAGGDYKITAPIEAYASVLINGAAGATIDASTLTGDNAIIKLPAGVSDMTNFGQIAFNNVNMKIATRLVYANKSKFWIEKIAVDNCVISVDGTFKKSIFDCNSGGNVKLLSVNNSTIYADPKIGQNGGFFSSQSSQKPTEFGDEETQTFQITNSTLYNITNGNNMVTLRENNKAYLNFIFKNNVIVNCGKNKEFFKGFGSANLCASSTWDVDGNIVNFGGVDTSADDLCGGEIKNPIKGVVTFADAAAGKFNGTLLTEAEPAVSPVAVGDPRWTIEAKKDVYSKSLNIEQLVLDKTTKADIAAALAEKKIEISSNAGLDSLNDEKTLRNEPFLGLKIKAADATVKVNVLKGQVLNVKFGCVNDPVNVAINGTPIDTQVAKNTEGSVFTLPAAEADQEVVFTTTAKNTVVLKQIMIGEDIAAVTLPAATKYQVSVAEGIENGTVEFDATSMSDSKGYKTVKVGDEVTIIAKPAEGYELEAVSVKGVTSNEAIVVTDGKFTMPADAVTINATFKVSTGINAVKADALKDAQIYNLQGVRVDKAQKGLYIVNGRKVVIK